MLLIGCYIFQIIFCFTILPGHAQICSRSSVSPALVIDMDLN